MSAFFSLLEALEACAKELGEPRPKSPAPRTHCHQPTHKVQGTRIVLRLLLSRVWPWITDCPGDFCEPPHFTIQEAAERDGRGPRARGPGPQARSRVPRPHTTGAPEDSPTVHAPGRQVPEGQGSKPGGGAASEGHDLRQHPKALPQFRHL